MSGAHGVEVSSTNILRLSGTNTYSGETVVLAGTLLVNGDNSGATGNVVVQGGVLGGTGTLGGDVFVSAGAALAPGDGPGTLSLNGNSLTMSAEDLTGMDPLVSTLDFELDGFNTTVGGGVNDLIDGVGDLTLDGTLNVAETTAEGFLLAREDDSWRLINYSGTLVDNNLELGSLPELFGGLEFSLDVSVPGQVNLLVVGAGGIACDFDGNDVCDITDINSLMAEISSGNGDLAFDMNGDGLVDISDRNQWLTEAGEMNVGGAYLVGDANLDGVVDVSDFNSWNSNKFSAGTRWDFGEFSGDGAIDISDFNLWNGNKFNSSDALNAVPEPSLGIWFLVVGVMLNLTRRTKRCE